MLIACGLTACDTAGNVEDPDKFAFAKYYGRDGDQLGADMVLTDDGGVLMLGVSRLFDSRRIYLVKANALGETQWEKLLGATNDIAIDIEPKTDGSGYVILSRHEINVDDHDFKLILIDNAGNKTDSVVTGYRGWRESPHSVTPVSDGGYIITGATQYDETEGFNPADRDAVANIFHWRCDAQLDFNYAVWENLYGDAEDYDAAIKTFESPEGSFYVFGFSNRVHPNNAAKRSNLQYYQIAANGIPSDKPAYVGEFQDNSQANAVIAAPVQLGGGFFQVGTSINSFGISSLQVTKFRETLTFTDEDEVIDEPITIAARTIEGIAAAPVLSSNPQGYLLLGEETRNLQTKNISLTKIGQGGNVVWSTSLGSEEENDEAAAVAELPDGRILVLGTVGVGDNQTKMALFKLNANGRLHD
jgi:hypothetical protein